ncbi:hypothetical protein BDN72DRAFT_865159 [Pluteus cervinus]|uniref:Uncharacterized protein n=1 Tax=Pluteus cervinus TaxID=181527 RepID=A0ACD3A1B9_9AGAR|nr:hypothetical protein BDN72DRAFT_865159 [Pluteus cervinus]
MTYVTDPQWFFTSPEIEPYLPMAVGKLWDTAQVGARLEAFAIAGCDTGKLFRTVQQKVEYYKMAIRNRVNQNLRRITDNPNIQMQYVHFESQIVLQHGVDIVGWNHPTFGNPSQLSSSLEPLKKLHDALVSGACKFVKLTEAECEKRKKEYEAKLANGETEGPQRKPRKDAGRKRGPNKRTKRKRGEDDDEDDDEQEDKDEDDDEDDDDEDDEDEEDEEPPTKSARKKPATKRRRKQLQAPEEEEESNDEPAPPKSTRKQPAPKRRRNQPKAPAAEGDGEESTTPKPTRQPPASKRARKQPQPQEEEGQPAAKRTRKQPVKRAPKPAATQGRHVVTPAVVEDSGPEAQAGDALS